MDSSKRRKLWDFKELMLSSIDLLNFFSMHPLGLLSEYMLTMPRCCYRAGCVAPFISLLPLPLDTQN